MACGLPALGFGLVRPDAGAGPVPFEATFAGEDGTSCGVAGVVGAALGAAAVGGGMSVGAGAADGAGPAADATVFAAIGFGCPNRKYAAVTPKQTNIRIIPMAMGFSLLGGAGATMGGAKLAGDGAAGGGAYGVPGGAA
jgi:hypothetical protein